MPRTQASPRRSVCRFPVTAEIIEPRPPCCMADEARRPWEKRAAALSCRRTTGNCRAVSRPGYTSNVFKPLPSRRWVLRFVGRVGRRTARECNLFVGHGRTTALRSVARREPFAIDVRARFPKQDIYQASDRDDRCRRVGDTTALPRCLVISIGPRIVQQPMQASVRLLGQGGIRQTGPIRPSARGSVRVLMRYDHLPIQRTVGGIDLPQYAGRYRLSSPSGARAQNSDHSFGSSATAAFPRALAVRGFGRSTDNATRESSR